MDKEERRWRGEERSWTGRIGGGEERRGEELDREDRKWRGRIGGGEERTGEELERRGGGTERRRIERRGVEDEDR